MQHDTTTCNMIQQHTTRWSNGTNFFFTTTVARCCMKSWDRLTGALLANQERCSAILENLAGKSRTMLFNFRELQANVEQFYLKLT